MDDTTRSATHLPAVSPALQEPMITPEGAVAMPQRAPARGHTELPTVRSGATPIASEAHLRGGGEMGQRIRAHDWAATPLGPVETWPQSLRSAVSILLPSRAQIVLFWGAELITLYNDAYAPVLGAKHPWALGRPAHECWHEVWHVLGPLFEGVVSTGEAFWAKEHPFFSIGRDFLKRRISTYRMIRSASKTVASAAFSALSASRPGACSANAACTPCGTRYADSDREKCCGGLLGSGSRAGIGSGRHAVLPAVPLRCSDWPRGAHR